MALAGVLSGCAQMPQWSWSKGFANLDFAPSAQTFNFDWQLSGDPQIAPIQVFDDGRRTWLQFAADQLPPALFRRTESGDALLSASRDGAYLVIDGVWSHVLVRAGHLIAHVRRLAPGVEPAEERAPDVSMSAVSEALVPLILSPPQIEPASISAPISDSIPSPAAAMPEGGDGAAWGALEFAVSPEDGNLRRALARWASVAGWTFGPEHWVVDVDIPLTASAAFGTAFKPAVRHLLAATELGDRPLQPCFYANQVLRIVPFAQRCDRSLAPGAV